MIRHIKKRSTKEEAKVPGIIGLLVVSILIVILLRLLGLL